MSKCEDISDKEINIKVALIEASNYKKDVKSVEYDKRQNCIWIESIGFESFPIADYCNNPSDAWPIIDGNRISLVAPNCGDKWRIFINIKGISSCHTYGKNGLRAAMIAFLKMNEDK